MRPTGWALFLFCVAVTSQFKYIQALELPDEVAKQSIERIEEGYHLATVIGIVDEDGMRFYGFGQLSEENSAAPDENSIFEIGSITKTFTATLLADLELQGVLRIDDPVRVHLPQFDPQLNDSESRITLEHLCNHTSGLPREAGNVIAGQDNRYASYTEQDLFEYLSNYEYSSVVGNYGYSNVGFMVLESAIEKAANSSYEALIENRVLSVLGMESTGFEVIESDKPRYAAPFRYGLAVSEQLMGEYQAMGGIRSTARDMLIFLSAHAGITDSALSPAIDITHSVRFQDDENVLSLGWNVLDRGNGKTIYFHSGGTNGYVSWAGFNPNDRVGVVVLSSGRRFFSDLGFHLLDSSYPLADPDRVSQ